MSIAILTSTLQGLPYGLREQILGYAESVRAAAPSIARDAGVQPSQRVFDELVFMAGVRKLHGLVASNYWALDNSTSLLAASEITSVRVGAQDFSRGGQLHMELKELLEALEKTLTKQQIKDYLNLSYEDLLVRLMQDGS